MTTLYHLSKAQTIDYQLQVESKFNVYIHGFGFDNDYIIYNVNQPILFIQIIPTGSNSYLLENCFPLVPVSKSLYLGFEYLINYLYHLYSTENKRFLIYTDLNFFKRKLKKLGFPCIQITKFIL